MDRRSTQLIYKIDISNSWEHLGYHFHVLLFNRLNQIETNICLLIRHNIPSVLVHA